MGVDEAEHVSVLDRQIGSVSVVHSFWTQTSTDNELSGTEPRQPHPKLPKPHDDRLHPDAGGGYSVMLASLEQLSLPDSQMR